MIRQPAIHVPERKISPPATISEQARAQLENGAMTMPDWPPVDDVAAWHALIAEQDAMGEHWLGMMTAAMDADVTSLHVGGVRVHEIQPVEASPDDPFVFLDIHGGSLVWGGGPSCAYTGKITARTVGARVWSVDYRMAPDFPFPAPLDDCVTAYRELLRQTAPEHIIIGGASAGGNLAAATVLRARDEDLPLPAGLMLVTPELDLTESGDSFSVLMGVDTALTGSLMPANLLHAGGHDLSHPYLSPLFGDVSKGFPPTWLQSGTRDLFLSNAVVMHRALRRQGIDAELHIFEAATHVMFLAGPEADDLKAEMRAFADRIWKRGKS